MENLFTAKKRWSSLAARFCVAVIAFAVGVSAYWVFTAKPQKSTRQQAPPPAVEYASAEPGTLRARILEAKANGDNTLQLVVLGCGWDIGTLKEALSRDTVVLAELMEKKTYEDGYGLHTWYRFKITETLVTHPPATIASTFQDGPSDMHPIADDEVLISETNGRMEIDGVTVTQSSNGAVYSKDQTYLLFLWIDFSKRTAIRTGTDPLGVFLVDNDGNLSSYVDRPYPLKTALEKRFKNSVNNMREALRK